MSVIEFSNVGKYFERVHGRTLLRNHLTRLLREQKRQRAIASDQAQRIGQQRFIGEFH